MRLYYFVIISCLFLSCQLSVKEDSKKDLNHQNWETDIGDNFKYGYVDTFGNVMIDYQFDRARPFNGNMAIVTLENSEMSHLINSKGDLISDGFNYINDRHSPDFYIGDNKNEEGKKVYYLINNQGQTISKGYSRIDNKLHKGVFIVKLPCDTCGFHDSKSCLVDKTGNEISEWYNEISGFTVKHFFTAERIINDDRKVAALSFNGTILSDWCNSISLLHGQDKLYEVEKKGADVWNDTGLMDSTGKIILKPSYRFIKYYDAQHIIEAIKKKGFDEYNTLYNEKLKRLTSPTKQKKYYPKKNELIGIPDVNKTYAFYKIEDSKLQKVSSTYQMKKENKSSSRKKFFSSGRRYFSWVEYSMLEFQNGFAPVMKNGKYGFINHEGKEVIQPKYTSVKFFKDGSCEVSIGSKVMIINEVGEVVDEKGE